MSPRPDGSRADWWNAPLDFRAAARGLTATDAAARLAAAGPNDLQPASGFGTLRRIARRLGNPLVLLLLSAATLSAILGHPGEAALVGCVILLSVTVDYVQEHRADRTAELLRARVATRTTVCRDGALRQVPMQELVPGDLIVLGAGDLVPADGRVLDAEDCFVTEAVLTGEPWPVAKRPAAVPVPTPEWRDAAHAVFMGTSLTAGRARVLVMATGPRTVLGGISRALAREPPATAFETGTRRFGLLIVRLTLLLVLAALLINAVHGRPWLDSFLFAVALAVGLTPELLPMVVSVTLAHGAARMARHRTIVRHLPAIQNLGSLDVLCTDKTGTLTESRIELDRHVDPRGRDSARVLELAWLNAHFSSGLRSPLDDAILRHTEVDANGWRKLAERPFDFERRRVGVVLERAGERRLVVKGAPETLLALCEHYETGDPREPARPLGPAEREALAARRAELSAAGLRTLAVAWRTVGDGAPPAADDERALVFAGYCAFLDPPKAGAAAALEALARDGVAVKILTGDEEAVARHVCRRLGLAIESSLSGAAVAALDEQALAVRAAATTLFYRVDPAQKERIVRALHRRGHVVGYLGDGLNDAPALHAADVGISVDGAVDVAREAAQFILLDHDLGVLHEAVMEGRRTHANLTKYLLMGTSSSFGNMFSMAAAAAFLPFLPMLPAQILLNNLLYDLSEIAIPFDAVDAEELARPRTWDVDVVRDFMMRIGPVSSAFDLLTFAILLQAFAAPAPLFQTGWFVESLTTQVLVIFVIRTRGSPLASRPHPALAWTALAVVALGWLLPATAVGAWFGLVPLPWQLYATIGLLAVGYLLLVERVKQAFFAGVRRRQRPC